MRNYLEFEVRRVQRRRCGTVKRGRLAFLADDTFYTRRFAHYRRPALPLDHDQGAGDLIPAFA